MEYKQLSEVCDIIMGQSPDSSSYNENRDGLPFYQGNADFGEEYPEARVWCNDPKKIADDGDILISVRAPIGAVNYAKEKCCIGRGLAAIRSETYNNKLLYYYLKSKNQELNHLGTGSTFKAIGKDVLSQLKLPVIDSEKQDEMASILHKAERAIRLRKQQLQALDDLIKARFVEMFGDPELGTCKYETSKLHDLTVKISDGVHAKPDYTMEGRPFLSVVNINRGVVDFSECKYVSEDAYQKMIKSTHPEKGDVLYTKVGATYGIPAYVDTNREFCLYVSVCLIKPNHERINSRFLSLQMAMPSIKHQADARIKGIGVPDLHLNQISEFDIVCPPRELQDEFVCFVNQNDKAKDKIQKTLDETQQLFDSLMQKYFG